MTLDTVIINGVTIGDLLSVKWLASVAGNVLVAILILIAAFVVANWARRRLTRLGEDYTKIDDTLFAFLGSVTRYVILAFAGIFILNRFGVQTASLIAVIGAAGLAIGLAMQGTLSNIAAGVMLILFRPFKKGDFIEAAGQMGTVQDLSIFTTEIASVGNVQVIVPNANIWGTAITNYSAYDLRRAEWTFGVGYGADLKAAEAIIRDTVMADERSLSDPAPFIQVNNLGASSVDFLVRVWVKSGDYFAYQADIKRSVKEALDKGSIDIPFPTRTIVQEKT